MGILQFKQIKESSLYVEELSRSRHFYHELIGLPVINFTEGRHVFFRAGTSVLLCFLAEATGSENKLPTHSAKGQIHIAFEVSGKDYDKWKQKLENAGVVIIHEQDWKEGKSSFYFRDPDGHLLEILPTGVWE